MIRIHVRYVYYGEYVHSFCACSMQVAMLDKCLEHGADINAQDTLGNTALHVVIMLSHRCALFLPAVASTPFWACCAPPFSAVSHFTPGLHCDCGQPSPPPTE